MNKITIPISRDDIETVCLVVLVSCMVIIMIFAAYLSIGLPFPLNFITISLVVIAIFVVDTCFFAGTLASFLQRNNPFKFRGNKK